MTKAAHFLMEVKNVVVHVDPHLDEILAYFFARNFGKEVFKGIENAPISFWGENSWDGKTSQELERDGVLLLGIGGGRFDEHKERGRIADATTAGLMAEFLGIADRTEFQRLLNFVNVADSKGHSQPYDLHQLVKLMNNANPEEPEKTIFWALDVLQAIWKNQVDYNYTAANDLATAHVRTVTSANKKLKVVCLKSDAVTVAKRARAEGADLVIVQRSSGHVQIFSHQRSEIDPNLLDNIACLLRFEEEMFERFGSLNFKDLRSEGFRYGWYYERKAGMFMNGCKSYPDIKPTKLELKSILKMVSFGLTPENDCAARETGCCRKSGCRNYRYGLHSCRGRRFKEKTSANDVSSSPTPAV